MFKAFKKNEHHIPTPLADPIDPTDPIDSVPEFPTIAPPPTHSSVIPVFLRPGTSLEGISHNNAKKTGIQIGRLHEA